LCSETLVEMGRGRPVRLSGEWIENEAILLAQGSPRRLVVALQLLAWAHIRHSGGTGVIQRNDWEVAKTELMEKMPPLLRLRRGTRSIWVGDREETLTAQEQ